MAMAFLRCKKGTKKIVALEETRFKEANRQFKSLIWIKEFLIQAQKQG